MNIFNIDSTEKTNIEDIFDGKLYKEHFKPNGILSFKQNISLLWNTDGIPVFKSSNYSLWPFYFIINELPYRLRMCKQNSLVRGLWLGSSKPNMQLFLRPIHKVLSKLESVGMKVCAKIEGTYGDIVTKVILLVGTCNLPATYVRALLQISDNTMVVLSVCNLEKP